MFEPDPPDLFAAAGIELDAEPMKPKRVRKPRPRTSAKQAAVVRLDGARRKRRCDNLSRSSCTTSSRKSADVYAFPPSRNKRLVALLLRHFQNLLQHHDREGAKLLFEDAYLHPLRVKLMRIGLNSDMIERELYALKAAVRDLGWRNHSKRFMGIKS